MIGIHNRAFSSHTGFRRMLFGTTMAAFFPCCTLATAATAPWEAPRDLSAFKQLLARSPFSLPTAEESSPLAERYAMTGIITIGGEEQVFVFDRTEQSRELLTGTPNAKNMSLVSIIREGNSPLKASIRVGGETGTIGFMETAASNGQPNQVAAPAPGSPGSANVTKAVQLPPLPQTPQVPAANTPNAPGRRIIRRPVITPPQPNSATP
jgi:hypothetical protein